MILFKLQLALRQPTRMICRTCIDNFAHNFSKSCAANVIEFALSDHTEQLLKSKRENIEKFKTYVSSLTFSDIYGTDDPNIAYNCFLETFQLFYELCYLDKIIPIHITKKPWVTRGIKICNKNKRKLLWQYRLK